MKPGTRKRLVVLAVSLGLVLPFATVADELSWSSMARQASAWSRSSLVYFQSTETITAGLADRLTNDPTFPTSVVSAAPVIETSTGLETAANSMPQTSQETTAPTGTTSGESVESIGLTTTETSETARSTTTETAGTTQSTTTETAGTTRSTTIEIAETTRSTTTETAGTTTATTALETLPTTASTESDLADQAAALHARAFVIDTHCDTLLDIVDRNTWFPVMNIGRETNSMIDIPKMKTGGIDLQVFAAYTSGYILDGGGQNFARANSRLLSLINGLKWTLAKNSSTLQAVTSLNDVQAAVPAGKIGVLSSIEGAYSLNQGNGLELLRQYADLGVRMLSLTWNHSNALGEGVNEAYKDGTPSAGGLTELGRSVILEMNRLGMVVDVSHLNETTFWETMSTTTVPVIASHSSVYDLNNNARNLKDEQIQAIAQSGGVVQVNFHRPFLAADPETVTIETLVDHIDYIVQLVGIDSVGLGSDFDGAEMPEGLENAAMLPRITLELVRRGYTDDDIEKILGANTARLFRDVGQKATVTKSGKNAPVISMNIEMGARLDTSKPVFSATIQAGEGFALDHDSIRLVIDGQVLIPEFDEATATASLTMTTPLTEQFHVITFVAANLSGETTRMTRIFAINQP